MHLWFSHAVEEQGSLHSHALITVPPTDESASDCVEEIEADGAEYQIPRKKLRMCVLKDAEQRGLSGDRAKG